MPAAGILRDKPLRTTVRMSDAKYTLSHSKWLVLEGVSCNIQSTVLCRRYEGRNAHRHSVYQLNKSHIINSLYRQAASRAALRLDKRL